ncbi:alanine racemase [Micromonospora sp. WMMD754]|uniref:alanine racemase n=1 Tax=Micromonospora sp. WMMD754 TaxID=3404114 RepID=UPI003BF5EB60
MAGLRPRLTAPTSALLDRPDVLFDLTARHGTPANVVFPQVLSDNVEAFRHALDGYRLPYRIFYAHKANQSRTLVRAAHDAGIDIDVASAGELAHARECGFPDDRIEVTGPKGERLLRRLVDPAGPVVNIDNLWELHRVTELAARPVPVLLRLSGGRRVSRFGMTPEQFDDAFTLIRSRLDAVDLRGVSFHLDTADVDEKLHTVDVALRLVERAHTYGLTPRVVNIGGGFRQAYLAAPDEFDAYVGELRRGLLGRGPRLGWGDYTFGYQVDRIGALRGTPVFHRYANATPGVRQLRELLDRPLTGGRTVAETIGESMLELWTEPGKALVDGAGLTVAAVEFTKRAPDGSILVTLDLSRDMLTPADQEVMLDPIVLYRGTPDNGPCEVFLAGNLCLERDMVSNHLVRLPALPRPGDLMVFVNTAAYQMDLSAAPALMHPRPPKVAVRVTGDDFTVSTDGDEECSTTT